MNKKKSLKWLIGLLCVVLLMLVVIAAILLDNRSPEPILGIFQTEPTISNEGTENSNQEEGSSSQDGEAPTQSTTTDAAGDRVSQPELLPPSVVIQPETDPETGESMGITFPCQIPGYDMVIERLAPYNGMFVEDGTNADVENVAILLVRNSGNTSIEYTQICVDYGQEKLVFDISALPAGEKLVVQEKTGKAMSTEKVVSASALVVQKAEMEMSESKVKVIDNGDNTLTVQNLTDETIPTVRVFYKYYMEAEDLFVGGIAFTVRISRLGGGSSVKVQPAHYISQSSRVVMVTTYDSEV